MTDTDIRFRFSKLTPEQEAWIRAAWYDGMRASVLASQYGVSTRTIYRAIHRTACSLHPVVISGWGARFRLEHDGPIQMEPWRPV